MPKQKKQNRKYDDEEIIIGYNTKRKKDNPPKTRKEQKENKKLINKNSKQVKHKNKKKKKQKKRKSNIKKILKILLKIVIIIGIAAGIILFLFVSPIFNIKTISVTGAKEISESVYIAMTGIEIGENIFKIDKMNMQYTIDKEPYVESVKINSIYPNKIEINVTEREAKYIVEENGKYYYIDKNGYLLETSLSPLELPKIKGTISIFEDIEIGARINEIDLSKFNDLIKIIDAVQNNNIDTKLTSIDISDHNNYILEFADENKNIMLGEASDLSAKMAWINLFMKEKKNESGTIYLNAKDIYFAPNT